MVSFHRPSLTWLSNPNLNPNLNQATPRAVLVAVSCGLWRSHMPKCAKSVAARAARWKMATSHEQQAEP